MKNIWMILGVVAFLLALGSVGHYDYEMAKLEQASNKCQNVDVSVYHSCVDNILKEIK